MRDEKRDKRIARHVIDMHLRAGKTDATGAEDSHALDINLKRYIQYCRMCVAEARIVLPLTLHVGEIER